MRSDFFEVLHGQGKNGRAAHGHGDRRRHGKRRTFQRQGEIFDALAARFFQNPLSDGNDQTGFFGDADKFGRVDQAARLGQLTGMSVSFVPSLLSYDGGQYGLALLSRYPIRS